MRLSLGGFCAKGDWRRGLSPGYNLEWAMAVVGRGGESNYQKHLSHNVGPILGCGSVLGPAGSACTCLAGGGGGLGFSAQRSETQPCDCSSLLQYHQTVPLEVHLVKLSSSHISEIVFDSVDFFIIRSWLQQWDLHSTSLFPR